MQACLTQAQLDSIDLVSLQASAAAKDLYRQLGFQELFVISNYQR
jgi:ribosomal protein S18 acetylase RimI-like enzyme